MKNVDKVLKIDNIVKDCNKSNNSINHYEKKVIKLREEVNELFFNRHFSKSMIARKKRVARNFVIKWTQSPDQDFTKDARGWVKGKRRKWSKSIERIIRTIYRDLESNPQEFYIGATVIEQEWRRRFPQIVPAPLRTIGKIISDLGLSAKRRKDRHMGASKYLCYPEHTIYNLLGGRVLEADFIGEKYLAGRTEPLNFIGFSFKKMPKLRYFKRVSGQTADDFIEQCGDFIKKFEKPDFVKVDNCLATIGSASAKRNISRTMESLLKNQIIPIFAVPKKPFSQASIEGNNSVFSRKFWNRIEFKDVPEVDEKLEWFNLASQRYTGYQSPEKKSKNKKNFIPKVYFIRQVKENKELLKKASIDVLNEKIILPNSYINYYVLAEWNIQEENLYIYFEKEQQQNLIEEIPFKINSNSKIYIK